MRAGMKTKANWSNRYALGSPSSRSRNENTYLCGANPSARRRYPLGNMKPKKAEIDRTYMVEGEVPFSKTVW